MSQAGICVWRHVSNQWWPTTWHCPFLAVSSTHCWFLPPFFGRGCFSSKFRLACTCGTTQCECGYFSWRFAWHFAHTFIVRLQVVDISPKQRSTMSLCDICGHSQAALACAVQLSSCVAGFLFLHLSRRRHGPYVHFQVLVACLSLLCASFQPGSSHCGSCTVVLRGQA